MGKRVLVTGAAGFIGFHLSKRLCNDGYEVVGVDNLNDYYDVNLKKARLDLLLPIQSFEFHKIDIGDRVALPDLFEHKKFDYVVNLAAQAGVRYSLTNPFAYTESNITGFLNILECCRHYPVEHLIYASSSSVYGGNTKMPFSVNDNVDHPLSLYAATKKANELMAHTYAHLYNIPTTGLRFFTVYGPWGRPDMALFLFTKAIIEGKPIRVFNHGKMKRDFTYIDDIIEGVVRLITTKPGSAKIIPYALYNIGNNQPVALMEFIEKIEASLNKKAIKEMFPMQPGDVSATYADVDDLIRAVDFRPKTPLQFGVDKFTEWYLEYHRRKS
ncbi:MAG: NAD-dependent epimerase [Bacteroidetes bacterium]|nr:NAD-dependent epimerase [Bacteroidota bacterium]MDA1120834.1 NAD-dependent epimerase [Bacteroidota bacterium]